MTSTPGPPRIRKNSAQRHTEIDDAARALALSNGLSGVTLRAIAGRMGVASGLVAHYAPSMDHLVASTFTAIVAAELEDVRQVIASTASPISGMGALIDTLLDDSRVDVTLVWVQAWALGSSNAPLASAVRREMDHWQRAIAELVERGTADGAFRTDDGDGVAWHLLAMIDGLNAHSLVRWKDAEHRRALTKRSVAALLGISPEQL